MAITNPDILLVGDAAITFFKYYGKDTEAADQTTSIEDDINDFDATGVVSVSILLALANVGVAQQERITSNQVQIDIDLAAAALILKNYFEDYPTATGIVNEEGTQQIVYDSMTEIVSIVPYP